MRRITVIILCVFLAGCSETAWGPIVKMMMDEEMEARVDQITQDVIARDREALAERISPSYTPDAVEAGLTGLFSQLPDSEVLNATAILESAAIVLQCLGQQQAA
jgi:hypothetical protein